MIDGGVEGDPDMGIDPVTTSSIPVRAGE